ncbi:MAG: hypothetical protein ACXQTS_05300 [Candidatus Methanospirareceae archaeon]
MREIERILRLKEVCDKETGEGREKVYREIKEMVQRKWECMVRKGLIHGAYKLIRITGVYPDVKSLDNVIQSVYKNLFRGILDGEIQRNVEKMKRLYEMTGMVPELESERVQEAYERLLKEELLSYFDILWGLTAIKPREYLLERMEELRRKRERQLKEFRKYG